MAAIYAAELSNKDQQITVLKADLETKYEQGFEDGYKIAKRNYEK